MVAPIDSSYLELVNNSLITFPTSSSLNSTVPAAYTEKEDYDTTADLSGYYSDKGTSDLFTEVSNNVVQSAKALDNAMVTALENGYGVQDAVNVNLALHAYQANNTVAKSTFELKI